MKARSIPSRVAADVSPRHLVFVGSAPTHVGGYSALRRAVALVLLFFSFHISSFVLPALAQQYAIPWFKVAGGGGMMSTGGVYALSGTIGQSDAGRVAYTNVFRIEAGFWAIAIQQLGYPPLNITRTDTNYFVSWKTPEPGLILQQAATLATPTVWNDTTNVVSTNGITNLVQQAIDSGVSNRYYRLRQP